VVAWLAVEDRPIPEVLAAAVGAVMIHFFGKGR
jgi:hypothetical protein